MYGYPSVLFLPVKYTVSYRTWNTPLARPQTVLFLEDMWSENENVLHARLLLAHLKMCFFVFIS